MGVIAEAIGAAIRRRRDGLGITQVELSRRLGVDQSTLSRIESVSRGQRVTAEDLVLVARCLGTTASALLEGIE